MNDLYKVKQNKAQRCLSFVFKLGLIAVRKSWLSLETSVAHWQQWAAFIDFAYLELPAAQTHGAKTDAVKLWARAVDNSAPTSFALGCLPPPSFFFSCFLSEQLFPFLSGLWSCLSFCCWLLIPFILFLIIVIICLCLSKNNKSLIKKNPLVTSVFHSRWCKVLHTVESQVNIVAAAE